MIDTVLHDIGSAGQVAIRVRSGDVRVRGIDGTTARVRTADPRDVRRLHVETATGALSIDARASAALEVEVPRTAAIRIDAGSADLTSQDIHGEQHYRSASGDIRCERIGGTITVDAVSGDIDLVVDGPGQIQARTVSGDLAVRAGSLAAFRGATTSGDLRVAARFEGVGPFTIETVSGDAVIAPAGPLRIESSTITGDVRADVEATVDGARGRRALTIGRGGPTLMFRSTSGDLRVVRAVEHQPAGASAGSGHTPEPPPPPAPPTAGDAREHQPPGVPDRAAPTDPRLAVLQSLEQGHIDVAEAERRLASIDEEDRDDG